MTQKKREKWIRNIVFSKLVIKTLTSKFIKNSTKTLATLLVAFIFMLPFSKASSQSFVPITNYHNGISIEILGNQGEDYVFDRYYFDPLINDCGLCYIKSDIDIKLFHNSNNSRFINDETIITGGDAGDIRIKIDKDWQTNFWAGDNAVPLSPYPASKYQASGPFYPYYTDPFSFNEMEYEDGVPVVGSIGLKPGIPLNMDKEDRKELYSRGLLDNAGNEYHYLTYADDDDQDPQWKNLEMSASDGKSMLFCVNPKTPAIWLTAATSGAQYYTTPGKVNWVPKFHEQTSYVMDDVDIQLKNIMNSDPVYYRVDGGSYIQYSGSISSNTLADGEHILEFYYNPDYVQTRIIIKNPDHPCKADVFEDGVGHGYLLWKDDADLQRFRERCLTGVWSNNEYYTRGYEKFKSDYLDKGLSWQGNQGVRNPEIGKKEYSFLYAVVGVVEGVDGNEAYMDQAKVRLLNNQRMHIEHIGVPLQITSDANPSIALTYRGYYTDWVLYNNAFIYDILAKYYRSDQYPGGISPIEDLRIRDMLAQLPHEGLMTCGGFRSSTVRLPHIINEVMGFTGMQILSHQNAGFITALAMPSYNTPYYGTSGFNGAQAAYSWTPYPDSPQSWKDVYYTYTNYQDPSHLAQIDDFPNRKFFYNWYDGTLTSGMIREDGSWDTKPGYIDVLTCGHGMEIFYNVVRRRLDITYPKFDLFMQKSIDGGVWCHQEQKSAIRARRMMANEYFPQLAPLAMNLDPDGKYFYRSRGYYLIFHNPDWESVSFCESTVPPTVPSNLTGIPAETSVALSWSASTHTECSVSTYRITRNGMEIATINNTQYTDANLTVGTQYEYAVTAVSEAGISSAYCTPIQVTTLADLDPPLIENVPNTDITTSVFIEFNEDVDAVSAQTTSNYTIDKGISVLSADLQPNNTTVNLTVSTLTVDMQYTLTINNVTDLQGNTIDVNSTATFDCVEPSANLALNKPVTVDSEHTTDFVSENAVDGITDNNTSRWISANSDYPHWIEIDLLQTTNVDKVDFYTGHTNAEYLVYDYQIQYWNGNDWIDAVNITGNTLADVSHSFAAVTTDKIRLYSTAGQDKHVRIFEIEVYNNSGSSAPIAVDGISVSPPSLDLIPGQSSSLTKVISPSNATDQSVSWSSANNLIATVDTDGKVTAMAKGTTKITVTTNDGSYTADCAVTVNEETVIGYYCDPVNGSMSNNGSQASPWASLEDVFAGGKTFVAGDIIYLMDGHHGDPQVSGNSSENDYITIKALEGHAPVVKGLDFSNAHKWKVEGIDVYPNEYLSEKVKGNDHYVACNIANNCSFITFDNCHFYSKLYSETTGWTQDQWYYWTWVMVGVGGDDCTVKNSHFEVVDMAISSSGERCNIENNLIEYITEDGIRVLGDYSILQGNTIQEMIYCGRSEDHNDAIQSFSSKQDGYDAVTGVQIVRNKIIAYNEKNRDHILYMQCMGLFDGWFDGWVVRENVILSNHWHGITFLGARNCEIVNNTVIKLDGATSGDPGIRVQDLKSTGNSWTGNGYANYTGSRTSSNNIVRNNITYNISVVGPTNISENNLILTTPDYPDNFVDWLNLDVRLKEGSAAINAGTNVSVSDIDLDGNTRIIHGIVDLGAYEYTGVAIAATDVTVSPTSAALHIGGTVDLSETVLPTNTTDKSVQWTSNNTSVATVNANGLVTANAEGTCVITVTTNNGGFTAECNVSVDNIVTTNLAIGKPVTVDSEYNTTLIAANAIDGDNTPIKEKRWLSGNTPYPHWIEIDLEKAYDVSQVNFWTGTIKYEHPVLDYQIQYWDGSEWVDIVTITSNTNPEVTHTFPAVNTEKIRLYCTNGGDNIVRLFEVEVWGEANTSIDINKPEGMIVKPIVFIHPNPINKNTLTITLAGYERIENVNIHLLDISGKLIKKWSNIQLSSWETKLNLRPDIILKPGIYILQVNGKCDIQQQKLIVR